MLNPLLKDEEGFDADTFLDKINPDSLKKITAWVEPRVLEASPYDKFQFVRQGYFSVDPKYSTEGNPVFNQVVPLKSSWRPGK